MKFIYTSKKEKGNGILGGVIDARHSFEALHNARVATAMRGGDARFISLVKIV